MTRTVPVCSADSLLGSAGTCLPLGACSDEVGAVSGSVWRTGAQVKFVSKMGDYDPSVQPVEREKSEFSK